MPIFNFKFIVSKSQFVKGYLLIELALVILAGALTFLILSHMVTSIISHYTSVTKKYQLLADVQSRFARYRLEAELIRERSFSLAGYPCTLHVTPVLAGKYLLLDLEVHLSSTASVKFTTGMLV